MQSTSSAGSSRRRWVLIFIFVSLVSVIALTAYTSYTVYGLVRNTVAHSTNLPSFAILAEEAGLSNRAASRSIQSRPTPNASTTESSNPMGASAAEAPEPVIQERVNILIMGVDQRAGEKGPFRTDTMIVVTIDPKTATAGIFSIPRDLWVPIPGYGENRINTANFIGDAQKYPGGGPALAKKTVSYNFGFPVHYYVRLNFEGFKRIIDTIGGVDIQVEREIRDEEYPDEHYGYDPLYIPAGLIHMDGELALKYARTRKADDDFQRAHRQQQVILAVKDKVLSLNLLPSLLPKIPELNRTLSDAVQTDMPLEEIIRLARLARSMDLSNVKTVVIDRSMTVPHFTPQGAAVLLPIREQIRPIVDELFWSPLPTVPASSLRVSPTPLAKNNP